MKYDKYGFHRGIRCSRYEVMCGSPINVGLKTSSSFGVISNLPIEEPEAVIRHTREEVKMAETWMKQILNFRRHRHPAEAWL
jgi:hypothetical protein